MHRPEDTATVGERVRVPVYCLNLICLKDFEECNFRSSGMARIVPGRQGFSVPDLDFDWSYAKENSGGKIP
jgi:hypothetical protein